MSRVLDSLKRVNEQLSHNYTSYQLLSVLDKLIWKAMWPIINSTNYFDRVLASVLAWSAVNPRRKISSLPRDRLTTYAVAFLASEDPKMKMRILRKMRLERNIPLFVIDRFLALTDGHPVEKPEPELIDALCIKDLQNLWFAVRECGYWRQHAIDFKGMILEKYMRLVMMEAQMFYKQQRTNNPHLNFDLDDIAQNFVLAVDKAVNKCDAHQGTLTSYIQNWIKDAKGNPQLRGEYGIAYTIPASQRRSMAKADDPKAVNISVSIDSTEMLELASDTDIEKELERKQTISHIRLLAKRVDPTGIARMFLGIGEVLTVAESSILTPT
jgi:hypothetical protein